MKINYTSDRLSTAPLTRRLVWLSLISMLALGLLCSLAMPDSAAQGKGQQRARQKEQKRPVELEQKTNLPKIMTVTGSGGGLGGIRKQFERQAAPTPLSAEVKNSVIKSAGGKEAGPHNSFTLTPAKPNQGQGALAFEEIAYLDPAQNELTIDSQDTFWDGARANKAVLIFINTTAGKKYLIDLSVTGDKFFVTALPGNTKETFSGTHHVLIVFEARSSQLEINLTGTGANGQHVWTFHSCEVTTLN